MRRVGTRGWLQAAQGELWSQPGSQGRQQLRDAEGQEEAGLGELKHHRVKDGNRHKPAWVWEGATVVSLPSTEGVPAAQLAQMHLHQCSGALSSLCSRDMKMPEQKSHALPRHQLHICSVLPPCSQDPMFWSRKGLWLEPGGPWAL